ncbi:hypothetical protein E1B28_001056 [Marasmius oreades]|uniref:EamA domain-containing protein n=1 Tax=Marasmius oreades TaxID=181124 RepID=A0A9P7V2U4_9AGAR|nr:uncharacterized protein E1B28_001056 [Marasmius oreades]KAG7099187.1 hypothetical protein E1B28_001056 [Marasmius oreades]
MPLQDSPNRWSIPIFAVTLIAFVAESQLTQYVQIKLQYQQPYLLFYIVHSSFLILYPCHILYLILTTPHTPSQLWNSVKIAITNRLNEDVRSTKFPLARLLYLILALTAGITVPALLWFAAIAISSVTDVTAIWNTNAFFAYVISVKVIGLEWEARRLVAVVLATLGVIAVVYGGTTTPESDDTTISSVTLPASTAHLAGNLLTLIASVGYGAYQVFYKKYAALSSDPDTEGLGCSEDYQRVPVADDGRRGRNNSNDEEDIEQTPPFGLHPNFLTSAIGVCTLLLLWIPIPVLHWTGAEPFALPRNWSIVNAIVGIALTGSIFNGGFMILLGLWGPIITSVGGLLTIVLVFISDVLLGTTEAFNFWTVSGSTAIIAAFAVLAYDIVRK